MYQSLHCVALRTVRYDDRRAIVTAWSREAGRVSIVVPDGSSREARRRRAMLMPLSLFEGESEPRPGREILSMRDMRPSEVLPDISSVPAKSVVAMFLAEVLERLLREAQPDELLWCFLQGAIRALDIEERPCGVANFPITFLYRLGRFAGVEPDAGAWRPESFFDMTSGRFVTYPDPSHASAVLEPAAAAAIPRLARLTFAASSRLRLDRGLRRRFLTEILKFYSLHHTDLQHLRSLPVVSEIF